MGRKITKACKFCGVAFQAEVAEHNRGNAKFCGKPCQVKDQHRNGTNGAAASKRGVKHHLWKGGRQIDHHGYARIQMPNHPMAFSSGYVLEHVYVACKSLGRPLHKNEVVHHKDENRLNNSPSNLLVMTRSDHVALHHTKNPQRRATIEATALVVC